MKYSVKIYIRLKREIVDPEGLVIRDTLSNLGYKEVGSVRTGKYITLDLEAQSSQEATEKAEAMCEELLSNPVIEEYEVGL